MPTLAGDHSNRITHTTAVVIQDIQDKTGTLSFGGHGGSYNGQDAYNDMLVVDHGKRNNNNLEEQLLHERTEQHGGLPCIDGVQGSARDSRGGTEMSDIVRRLTPMECERLQGYPDGWTDIGEWTDTKGKQHKEADSPRYKALGNSIALPFWEWMAKRMVKYIDHEPTMGSLFDGIGGFPLVYSRAGCKPIWASEIEEFPIAVTKIRFPEQEETDGKEAL